MRGPTLISSHTLTYPVEFAPKMINLVGLKGNGDSVTNPQGRWFEVIPPERITPQDFYRAQLERRLGEEQEIISSFGVCDGPYEPTWESIAEHNRSPP